MSSSHAIEIEHVHFRYPDGTSVLHDINCHIHAGEKVALIGPNGAGKSTFMSLLNGVHMPSEGSIRVGGLPLTKANLHAIRRKIGIVFQDPDDQLFSPTVFDDVAFGPLNLGLPKEAIEARVQQALEIVGLQDYTQRAPHHLSFGEKKRLALATVLSYQPDILVFDEPSTNMDPQNRRNLIHWLKKSDKTTILCTHDLDIALEVCSRCLLLADGHLVADGPAAKLLHDRKILEQHRLELPLALMTHDILHELLDSLNMEQEHKKIIGTFLHTHKHVHEPDQSVHFHFHAHPHNMQHLVADVGHDHLHHLSHVHDHAHPHDHDGHTHSHGQGDHTHPGDSQPHGPADPSEKTGTS